MKKVRSAFILLLILSLALPFEALAAETSEIRGYTKAQGYQYVAFGAYPTDADGTVKPILWRVLRSGSGEAWLLSEYILFAAPVHGDYDHYAGWESSDLYKYLNETFINDAFSAAEQSALLIRTEDNAKVTLITSDDMKDASIGFASNNDRLCEGTEYAKVKKDPPLWELPSHNWWKDPPLYIYSKGKIYSPWWSRTRSSDYPHEQRRVMDEGKIGRISTGNSDLGVRPTVFVDLSLLSVSGGTGTKDDPYLLTAEAVEIPATEAPVIPEATPELAQTADVDQPADNIQSEAIVSAPAEPFAGADPHFPALTSEGYLPAGESEFSYADEDAGLWLYASQTLRIEINRQTGQNAKKDDVTWYEAHIYSSDPTQFFRPYHFDDALVTNWHENKWKYPGDIVAKNHLVFAINSDHFIYRVARSHDSDGGGALGLVIRDGKILFEKQKSPESQVYPPLDIMALYPDGSVKMYVTRDLTGKQMLATGATDTLSFGPILVQDGEISPRSKQYGETFQPRTAFGVAEPGHFVCVVVEGRRSGYGQSCIWLAEKMHELGCQNAINLDGGGTAAMLLMGRQINKSGNFGGENHRLVNEVLGIGFSEAVQ